MNATQRELLLTGKDRKHPEINLEDTPAITELPGHDFSEDDFFNNSDIYGSF